MGNYVVSRYSGREKNLEYISFGILFFYSLIIHHQHKVLFNIKFKYEIHTNFYLTLNHCGWWKTMNNFHFFVEWSRMEKLLERELIRLLDTSLRIRISLLFSFGRKIRSSNVIDGAASNWIFGLWQSLKSGRFYREDDFNLRGRVLWRGTF